MKHESVDFQEIFGASTVRESLDAVAPVVLHESRAAQLPTDNPLWDSERVTGGRSAEQVQDQEFIKAVSGCDWQPILTPEAAPLAEFTKRATSKGLTRQDISARMTKHYHHGLWRQWESMMTACVGDAAFDEQKALSFLRAA
jgi:hypothetical protein